MSDKIYFNLGPVQGFVAQARRTRDLWSGSFLLSYLAGCAINEVIVKDGEIIIPDVKDDALLDWIRGSRDGEAPMIGSLPNRFEASADDPKMVARCATKAIQDKWNTISQAVWDEFVVNVAKNGRDTKAIWDRQVKGFWEISWVIGPDISAMNSRKSWRINRPTDEAGDHCTTMGDWQELSGFIRSKSKERIKQDEFWKNLRYQSKLGRLDIKDGERLCALALIKRLFPKISKDAIGWSVETNNWPSTPYVAAVPWLKKVIDAIPEGANNYARAVIRDAPEAQRKGVSRKIGFFSKNLSDPFLNLDGNFYFENALLDCKRTPLEGTPFPLENGVEESEEVKRKREKLKYLLKGLTKWDSEKHSVSPSEQFGDSPLVTNLAKPDCNPLGFSKSSKKVDRSPVSFYAMLLMDGDNMGKLIEEYKGEPISKALSIFTKGVRTIVRDYNGVTIYAGGDDVLAMLPMPDALECALSLSKKYKQSFDEVIPEAQATISAGLVFSHYHIPLNTVMQEAHHILDDVAKDKNGRGSIAVSVLKPSGKYCQWTVTWDRLTDSNDVSRIYDLVSKVQDGPQKQFSISFFYGMRDDLAILSGDQILKPGSYAKLVEGLDPVRFLTAEYLKSRERKASRKEAEERVNALLELSYQSINNKGIDKTVLSPDAAMLIKFLSQTADGGN